MSRAYRPRIRPGTVYRRGTDYLVVEAVVFPKDARGPGDVTVYYVSTYADVPTRNGPEYPTNTASCFEELREWWITLSGRGGCYRKVPPADIPPRWRDYFALYSNAYPAA